MYVYIYMYRYMSITSHNWLYTITLLVQSVGNRAWDDWDWIIPPFSTFRTSMSLTIQLYQIQEYCSYKLYHPIFITINWLYRNHNGESLVIQIYSWYIFPIVEDPNSTIYQDPPRSAGIGSIWRCSWVSSVASRLGEKEMRWGDRQLSGAYWNTL